VYWPLFLGTIVILVIVLLPKGFVGLVEGRPWRTRPTTKA
jgi:ABC-type branched-subunit amino acid transport system permease subunit